MEKSTANIPKYYFFLIPGQLLLFIGTVIKAMHVTDSNVVTYIGALLTFIAIWIFFANKRTDQKQAPKKTV